MLRHASVRQHKTELQRRSCWIEVQLFKGQRKKRENNLLCKDKVEREREREESASGGSRHSGQMRGGCGRSRLPTAAEGANERNREREREGERTAAQIRTAFNANRDYHFTTIKSKFFQQN